MGNDNFRQPGSFVDVRVIDTAKEECGEADDKTKSSTCVKSVSIAPDIRYYLQKIQNAA